MMDFPGNWLDWITHYEGRSISIEAFFEGNVPMIADMTYVSILHNTKQFLRSLYFHLVNTRQPPDVLPELLPKLQTALEPINAF